MSRFRSFLAEQRLTEMSIEKLRAYVAKARPDYQAKIKTNVRKSIKRAKKVQSAEIAIMNKEEAIPANNVGGGQIAGAGVGQNGEPGVSRKRDPRIKPMLKRQPPK